MFIIQKINKRGKIQQDTHPCMCLNLVHADKAEKPITVQKYGTYYGCCMCAGAHGEGVWVFRVVGGNIC